jgi:hypothetical protein
MGDLTVGPVDVCSKKQKGNHVGPGNTGLVPAPPPPAGPKGIPVPTVVKIDTGKPDSKRVQKVKHNGADANNEKTIFKGTIGDPMHVGDLPPSTPKKDVVSWVKENLGFTITGHPTCKAEKKGFVMVGAVAMANAGSKKAQIPTPWLSAGGTAMFSADCRAAMIKCGIDPDAFGTYEGRAAAQSQARRDWQEEQRKRFGDDPSQWPDPASQAELDRMAADGRAGQFVTMNSQSGHLVQNNFFQSRREDSCSNYPPQRDSRGNMTNSGGYGYSDSGAACTDHMAGAEVRTRNGQPMTTAIHRNGHEHREICNSEAQQRANICGPAGSGGAVGPGDIRDNANATAGVMVNGTAATRSAAPSGLAPAGSPEAQRAAITDNARQRQAAELQANEGAAASAGGASGATGGSSNSKASAPTDADKQKAIECISAAAQQALLDQRAKCINDRATQSGPASDAARQSVLDDYNRRNPPGVQNFDQLPPNVQGLAASRQRQMDLEAQGAASGQAGTPSPTQDQCLEHQANVLYQEQVMTGGLPGMGGRVNPPRGVAPTNVGPSGTQTNTSM